MNSLPGVPILVAVLFAAGAGIPLMAALNAGLGERLGNPVSAAFVLFMLAFATSAVLLLSKPLPSPAVIASVPARFYLGGFFVVFYILSITWIAPKIGLANAIFVVLLGQIVASALIDHFSILGVRRSSLTITRGVGIALMTIGLYLAREPGVDH